MKNLLDTNWNNKIIRYDLQDGETWFLAKDVCEILEIENVTQAVNKLDEDERSMLNIGRQGNVNMVNEAGLYNLILTSRKPESRAFKRWIIHEFLPSLRQQTGLETFEAFRLLDKKVQKDCMSIINTQSTMDQKDYIITNKKVNEITCDSYGIEPINKRTMEKEHPEMLIRRQDILTDYAVIYGIVGKHRTAESVCREKYIDSGGLN